MRAPSNPPLSPPAPPRRQASGALVEMEPLCVLDFYVYERCQRMGIGLQLMEVCVGGWGVGGGQLLCCGAPAPSP